MRGYQGVRHSLRQAAVLGTCAKDSGCSRNGISIIGAQNICGVLRRTNADPISW